MNIAYVSTIRSAAWGGSEELWYQSAVKAIEENHKIAVFIYDWEHEPAAIRSLRKKGALICKRKRNTSLSRRLIIRVAGLFRFDQKLFLNPYNKVRKFRPDRIIITDGATYYTANDQWLRNLLTAHFAGQYIIICQGNGAYHFPNCREHAVLLFGGAKRIVFVADNNRYQAFHQLAFELSNTVVVQNPVNLTSFQPLPYPEIADGCIHFAVVGRLMVSDKGQDIVVAMMAEDFWRTANVVIHIYGSGSDINYLKDLIRFYNVESKVIIEGHASIEEIWSLCHALLMPSIIEGTPLTLLESMSLGRVCIVTDVGGNREWIKDGENGFLIAAPTQTLFSSGLKKAIERCEHWPKIAEQAHLDAIRRLDYHPGETLFRLIVS
jgi:L-malate glycosyltransferase